jgi:hypothetical protein
LFLINLNEKRNDNSDANISKLKIIIFIVFSITSFPHKNINNSRKTQEKKTGLFGCFSLAGYFLISQLWAPR